MQRCFQSAAPTNTVIYFWLLTFRIRHADYTKTRDNRPMPTALSIIGFSSRKLVHKSPESDAMIAVFAVLMPNR